MASWITKDWKLVSLLLDFIELKGAHSRANMADVVFKSLIDLDMKDKVIRLIPLKISYAHLPGIANSTFRTLVIMPVTMVH